MTSLDPSTASREDLIRALLDDKFAAANELRVREERYPDIVLGRSERASHLYRTWWEDVGKARERASFHLETLSRVELEKTFKAKQSEVGQQSPHEEKLFFNEHFAQARYNHWAPMITWSLEEATALLLARDPDIVNLLSLKHLHGSSLFAARFATLLSEL